MSHQQPQDSSARPTPSGVVGLLSRRWRGVESNLSANITPLHAFLVIFYALWVVGGLMQTDLSRSGKPTSPHSYDSGQAEIFEFETDGKSELELFALTPTWVEASFEIAAIPVVNDRKPTASIQLHSVSLLRGPPAV